MVWLWLAAAIITLLLTIALASFLLPNSSSPQDFHALYVLPQAVRGLVALVSCSISTLSISICRFTGFAGNGSNGKSSFI